MSVMSVRLYQRVIFHLIFFKKQRPTLCKCRTVFYNFY